MYIKLSFQEQSIHVPTCWNGTVLKMTAMPQILKKIPRGIKTGKSVNFNPQDKTYLYYLNLDTIPLPTLNTGLSHFLARYNGKLPAMIVDENYPENNALVLKLLMDLNLVCHRNRIWPRLFSSIIANDD